MRNSLLNGFSQIRHSLSATGREIHPRAVNLCDCATFVRTCVTLDKSCSNMFFLRSIILTNNLVEQSSKHKYVKFQTYATCLTTITTSGKLKKKFRTFGQ